MRHTPAPATWQVFANASTTKTAKTPSEALPANGTESDNSTAAAKSSAGVTAAVATQVVALAAALVMAF